ncbi:hypothetical protein M8C21_001421, partial [Ambrosia artemisiifolia]
PYFAQTQRLTELNGAFRYLRLIPSPSTYNIIDVKTTTMTATSTKIMKYTEFGTDGGPVVKILEPKLNVFTKLITLKAGIKVPEVDTKHVVVAMIVLQGFGGIGFIFGSYLGALLLALHQLIFTPVLYDFYNYDAEDTEFSLLFSKFTQCCAISLFWTSAIVKIQMFSSWIKKWDGRKKVQQF